MLIGIRLLLLVATLVIATTFVGYLFTRNPRLLKWCKTTLKLTLGAAALIALVLFGERLLMI